jgi:hypothetical protein
MISQQALQEFKEIFEREIGPLPEEHIWTGSAFDLLNLFNVVHSPIKKEWVEKSKVEQLLTKVNKNETPVARGISE